MRRTKHTAEGRLAQRWIPKDSVERKHPKGLGVVYTYQHVQLGVQAKFSAVAYRGTAAKSEWHYSYKTEADRDKKIAEFEPLLVIDGETVTVGTPTVAKAKVTADITEADIQTDKVTSIRYKAKKRVRTVRGHRQRQTVLTIKKIA